MPASNGSQEAPLPRGGQVGFALITLVALALDVLTVVSSDNERGQRWAPFGSWEPSIVQLVPVMTVGYAVLLLRRRWPLPVLAWICATSLGFTLLAVPSLPVAGILVTLYSAAVVTSRPWQARGALVGAVAAQSLGLAILVGLADLEFWLGTLLLGALSYSLWLFGRRDRRASLAAAGLPGQLAEHGELAAAQERRRIARELHDIVAHSVSAMMMQAAGAKAITTAIRHDAPDDARLETVARALATIENTGSESMRELHRLLSVLRGDDAEAGVDGTETSSQPGMADIAPLVELSRQSGLVVEVHTAGPAVRLDPSVGLAAYRVVQESLTNAMKHGGRGAIVDVFQNWQPDGLHIQVRCRSGHDGTPPGSMDGGGGLLGLHERVDLIGGNLESGWVGDQFVVTAMLPLTAPTRPEPGAGGPGLPTTDLHGRHGARLDGSRADTPGEGLAPGPGPMAAARVDDDRAGDGWMHTRQIS